MRDRGTGRPSLVRSLDKEIYQIVRKLSDEHDSGLQPDVQPIRLSVPLVYEKIKRSNSSLNRKSKKLLEDSIERVIDMIKEDWDESEDSGFVDDDIDGGRFSPPEGSEAMNKSVVDMWSARKVARKDGTFNREDKGLELLRETRRVKKPASDGENVSAPRKKKKTGSAIKRGSSKSLDIANIGGMDQILDELFEIIGRPILAPTFCTRVGVNPACGVLLHGPSGCGKTTVANAFAAALGVAFISISAPSIVSGMSGESEKALREQFDEAKKMAPCLIFLDEIDAIAPKRDTAQREMEKRIVAQLMTCMDDLTLGEANGKPVMVIAATTRPDSLDPALRRAGRFNKEINIQVPTEQGRYQILTALMRNLVLSNDIDVSLLAKRTPGYVGADLNDLVLNAAQAATTRVSNSLKPSNIEMDVEDRSKPMSQGIKALFRNIQLAKDLETTTCGVAISNEDFVTSLSKIQPMAKREGFATIPETTWADIGALESVRAELQMTIVGPIHDPQKYSRVGLTAPTAALLWGPPGCGKTLLAKAVANEARTNFISVKGPELLNKYVGESERAVRQVFEYARATVPCLIFFDELDALAPKRDGTASESSARVVNTLLIELDGLSARQGIYVLGATNRPDMIDDAILRGGRLETRHFVGLPGKQERVEILGTLTRNRGIIFDSVLQSIAEECTGFSGADLEHLVRRAGHAAIKRGAERLEVCDFLQARKHVRASVQDVDRYERLKRKWDKMEGAVCDFGNLVAQDVPSA